MSFLVSVWNTIRTLYTVNSEMMSGGKLFIKYAEPVVRKFVQMFQLHPFYYCHLLVVHMVQDMKRFGSTGMLNCSSIERMLKEMLRKETNKQESSSRIHYILQCVRRFEIKEEARQFLPKHL